MASRFCIINHTHTHTTVCKLNHNPCIYVHLQCIDGWFAHPPLSRTNSHIHTLTLAHTHTHVCVRLSVRKVVHTSALNRVRNNTGQPPDTSRLLRYRLRALVRVGLLYCVAILLPLNTHTHTYVRICTRICVCIM